MLFAMCQNFTTCHINSTNHVAIWHFHVSVAPGSVLPYMSSTHNFLLAHDPTCHMAVAHGKATAMLRVFGPSGHHGINHAMHKASMLSLYIPN